MMYELQHCGGCFLVKSRPTRCPACWSAVLESDFTVRTLEDYLSESRSTRNALLIRPTRGAFKDYKAKQDLHIGLTDGEGNLVEFNEHGLQFGTTEWPECFELGSIVSLISLAREHPGHSGENHLTGNLTSNFASLALNEEQPTDYHFRKDNLPTKDHLNGLNPMLTAGIHSALTSISSTAYCMKNKSNLFGKPASNDGDIPTKSATKSTTMCTEKYEPHLVDQYWNYTMQICKHEQLVKRKFNFETYDQLENNCLSFVFFFFKLLDLEPFKELQNKTAFCERLIKPRLSELFKIIEFDRSDSSGYLVVRNDFKPATLS